jgi:hypothetical protein
VESPPLLPVPGIIMGIMIPGSKYPGGWVMDGLGIDPAKIITGINSANVTTPSNTVKIKHFLF